MAKTGVTGIRRIIKAAGYSWLGLRAAYRHEAAFRQELWLATVLVPVGLYLGDSALHRGLLVGSVLLVLVVELLNSGMEAIVDRIGDEPHELSGRAKDMGSAAVLLSIILLLVTWTAVLFQQS